MGVIGSARLEQYNKEIHEASLLLRAKPRVSTKRCVRQHAAGSVRLFVCAAMLPSISVPPARSQLHTAVMSTSAATDKNLVKQRAKLARLQKVCGHLARPLCRNSAAVTSSHSPDRTARLLNRRLTWSWKLLPQAFPS